jgi:hypothetical protein
MTRHETGAPYILIGITGEKMKSFRKEVSVYVRRVWKTGYSERIPLEISVPAA